MNQDNPDEALLVSQRVDPTYPMPTLHQALRIALYDEYHARAVYTKVLQTFGYVLPFANIVDAEERHIAALLSLFQKYGVEPVIDDWASKVGVEPTLAENCEVGVVAEIDNIKMYDNLIPYAEFPDVLDVFYHLQAASFNNHLPAFRQCVANAFAQTQNPMGMQMPPQQQTTNPFAAGMGPMGGIPPFAGTNPQDLMNSIRSMAGNNPNLGALQSLFNGMGTEFMLGAAAGAVVTTLISGGALSNLFTSNEKGE